MDGLLLIDKPVGPTSHDVVARLRRALGERRVGHTGTLDPAASGVLAIVLGRATRLARFVAASEKRYETTVRLGVATDTYDAEGIPRASRAPGAPAPTRVEIDRALDAFRGTFAQRPPAFSAKKIGGKRSYALARAAARAADVASASGGGLVEPLAPAPAVVTAHAIDILGCAADTVTLAIVCSAGFYVRSLAHDLGEALGVGAHVLSLRRTRIGALDIADALPLEAVEADPARARAAVVPLARMLPEMPAVALTGDGVRHARDGRPLEPADLTGLPSAAGLHVRLVHPNGELVGIAAVLPGTGTLHPSVILM